MLIRKLQCDKVRELQGAVTDLTCGFREELFRKDNLWLYVFSGKSAYKMRMEMGENIKYTESTLYSMGNERWESV